MAVFLAALLPCSLTHFYWEHLLRDYFTGIHIVGAASEEPLPSHRGEWSKEKKKLLILHQVESIQFYLQLD